MISISADFPACIVSEVKKTYFGNCCLSLIHYEKSHGAFFFLTIIKKTNMLTMIKVSAEFKA